MRIAAVSLSLCLLVSTGWSAAQDTGISSEEAESSAMTLASCAGVWDAMSFAMKQASKPASAEQFQNIGNGAETAAMWVLASHHALTAGKATTYGSWAELTRPKREAGKNMILALAENGADSDVELETEKCQMLIPTQEEILQNMRKDRIRQQQDASNPA